MVQEETPASPPAGQPREQVESLSEALKTRGIRWLIATIDPLLTIVHLTIIYIVFLIADDLVLTQIERSFGDLISQSRFVADLLFGIKVFSALGVAVGYGLHTVYSLYLQAKHVMRVMTGTEQGREI